MIVTEDDLENVRLQHEGQCIVMAGGGFDLLHVGHLDYLTFSKAQGDVLVVGVVSDVDLQRRKGANRPAISQDSRARMVDSVKGVDHVFIEDISPAPGPTIKAVKLLRPEKLTFFSDMSSEALAEIRETLPDVEIVIDEQPKVESTTDIIKRAME